MNPPAKKRPPSRRTTTPKPAPPPPEPERVDVTPADVDPYSRYVAKLTAADRAAVETFVSWIPDGPTVTIAGQLWARIPPGHTFALVPAGLTNVDAVAHITQMLPAWQLARIAAQLANRAADQTTPTG